MSKNFLKSSLIIIIGSTVANAGGYLFHLALGRILSPAEYGALGALLSIYIIVSVPMSALQNVSAKIFSQHHHDNSEIKAISSRYLPQINYFSWIFFILFLVGSILGFGFLNLNSPLGLIMISLSILFIFRLAWIRGLMQGKLDFTWLSVSLITEGLGKFLIGVVLGLIFLRSDYTILSLTISFVLAYLLSEYYFQKNTLITKKSSTQSLQIDNSLFIESIRMCLGVLGILFFVSIDVILAKKFLPADQAGLYSAISTLGKIVFFAPSSIATALFPYAAREKNAVLRQKLLAKAILMVVGLSVVFIAAYYLFPELIFTILFGDKYHISGNLLALIAVNVSVVALAQLIINYLLSIKGWNFIWALLIPVICQLFFYSLWHADVAQMINIGLLNSTILLIFTSFALLIQKDN